MQFPHLLRQWRQLRRLSQLELSLAAGLSQRHLSFLETGRARPSRAMVLRLCDGLDIPLRSRNALLVAAGFAAAFATPDLEHDDLVQFRRVLEQALAHHDPYPALVLDGRWNLRMANAGALQFFGRFTDLEDALARYDPAEGFQLLRLCLDANGLRPWIRNFDALAQAFLARLRRALPMQPDDTALQALCSALQRDTRAATGLQLPEADPDAAGPVPPTVPLILERDGVTYRLFTMLAHFGAPRSVTLEELSLETFYPADAATERALRQGGPPDAAVIRSSLVSGPGSAR